MVLTHRQLENHFQGSEAFICQVVFFFSHMTLNFTKIKQFLRTEGSTRIETCLPHCTRLNDNPAVNPDIILRLRVNAAYFNIT